MKGIKQSQSAEHRVDSRIPNLTQFSFKQLHYHIMTMSLWRENEKELVKTKIFKTIISATLNLYKSSIMK